MLEVLCQQGTDRLVIAADMPGYGHSAGPRRALRIDELADWGTRLLDRLGIPKAHLAAILWAARSRLQPRTGIPNAPAV
jgi:pimeloyl-ACP methyl ester carboxylesterase